MWAENQRPGDNVVKLKSICIIDENNNKITQASLDQTFGVCFEYEVLQDNVKPSPNIHLRTSTNVHCFIGIAESPEVKKGTYNGIIWIPGNLLNNQSYKIDAAITSLKPMDIHLEVKEVISINVIENKLIRTTEFGGTYPGAMRPALSSEIRLKK
jgi:hypothetical protein